MHIAILAFDGFNELDALIALGILNRAAQAGWRASVEGWRVSIASPTLHVTSVNGVTLPAQVSLADAHLADAVILCGSSTTRRMVHDTALMDQLRLDPSRQLLAGHGAGALVLARLGLLHGMPVCTDLATRPWMQEAGVEILDQPFFARGNIATAGGCLASQYLAAWIIARLLGGDEARRALGYVAPVGEQEEYVDRAMRHVERCVPVWMGSESAAA